MQHGPRLWARIVTLSSITEKKMHQRSLKMGCAVVAMALSLAACSTPAGPTASSTPGAGQQGGIAVIALSDEPDTLDPTVANTFVSRVVFTSICEKLYDTNDKLNLVPQLAAELPKISPDGLTVDIQLRKDVKFNDGTPFDAAAVKVTLDRNRTLETSSRKKELALVESVEVLNESAVRLHLSRPSSPLGAQLADRAGAIMSPTALGKLGNDFGTDPVCVGPFTFKDRVAGSEINVVKSKYYYDADKVHLDGVTYKFITDPNIRAANLRSGDVNAAERLNASDVPQLKADSKLKILDTATIAYYALDINVDPTKSANPLAKSAELRKAFELSLNRKAINDVVFAGQNVVDCVPLSMQTSLRPKNIDCSLFDPDAARAVLKKSGEKLPIRVALTVPARPTDQKIAEVVAQMAGEVGFDISIKPVEFVSSLVAARAGDFEMFMVGWSGRVDPDGNLTNLVTTGGSNTFSQLKDAKLDQLVADAASATTADDRRNLYAKVLDRLADVRADIYLYHDTWFLGTTGIQGVGYSADAIPRFKTAELTK